MKAVSRGQARRILLFLQSCNMLSWKPNDFSLPSTETQSVQKGGQARIEAHVVCRRCKFFVHIVHPKNVLWITTRQTSKTQHQYFAIPLINLHKSFCDQNTQGILILLMPYWWHLQSLLERFVGLFSPFSNCIFPSQEVKTFIFFFSIFLY